MYNFGDTSEPYVLVLDVVRTFEAFLGCSRFISVSFRLFSQFWTVFGNILAELGHFVVIFGIWGLDD